MLNTCTSETFGWKGDFVECCRLNGKIKLLKIEEK